MALAETRPPNPRGEALVAELKWVHNMIRQDLSTVRQMASDVAAGLPAEDAGAAIRSLAASGPLWQLKVNCRHYCRFVHSHHNAESMLLFPELRRADPGLNPVVDKLEADHVHVAGLLEDVEAAADDLSAAENETARQRLVQALGTLSADLLAHLQYEEDHVSATLRTWTGWPHW